METNGLLPASFLAIKSMIFWLGSLLLMVDGFLVDFWISLSVEEENDGRWLVNGAIVVGMDSGWMTSWSRFFARWLGCIAAFSLTAPRRRQSFC